MSGLSRDENIRYKLHVERAVAPGFRLLVLPDQDEKKVSDKRKVSENTDDVQLESGLYIVKERHNDDVFREKQEALMQTSGIVIRVGSSCWKDYGDGTAWCKEGDRVFFKRYQGEDIEATNGMLYKSLVDSDILLIEKKEQD